MGGDGKMDVVVLEPNGIRRCGDDRRVVLVILRKRRRSVGARRRSRRANVTAFCQRGRACEADFSDLGLATRLGPYGLDPQTGSIERTFARIPSPNIDPLASQEGLSSEMRIERQLAAILAADVVGYSRLMGQDELGTLARLRERHTLVIGPKVAEHKGRIVRTTGDGFLVAFPSIVEAVECAAQIQLAMAEGNMSTPEAQRIVLRIGINIGDIMIEGGEIHGDGVNVAARLEQLAEAGGICVSAIVHDEVRDKLDLAFDDMGEHALKNIARARRLYRILVDGPPNTSRATTPDDSSVAAPLTGRRLRSRNSGSSVARGKAFRPSRQGGRRRI
jgi:class 3 adenylate cyclase